MNAQTHCPLCEHPDPVNYFQDARRPYLQCGNCGLVFVPPTHHLSRAAERAEYELHRNAVDDTGYRRFLSRLADPLTSRLKSGAHGLDFGCGPGPALAQMLREAGLQVCLYDSFFAVDESVWQRRFDFVCATEVVEHLHRPGMELERLWSCLEPGGWLGVMTKLVRDVDAFSRWHYKNDATHVCFFSETTWNWWAAAHDTTAEFIGADVILLQKGV